MAWRIVIAAVLVPLLLAMLSRRMTAPLVAVLYFGGTLLPALGFFSVYLMRYSCTSLTTFNTLPVSA